jgi:hypothetical protein
MRRVGRVIGWPPYRWIASDGFQTVATRFNITLNEVVRVRIDSDQSAAAELA